VRSQRKAARGGFDAGQPGDQRAQPADLDAQARAMRLVGPARPKGGCD